MSSDQLIQVLSQKGEQSYANTLKRHGIEGQIFGVKIAELKLLIKKHKLTNDNELAVELYQTQIYDAMYLAMLIYDATKMNFSDFLFFYEQTKTSALLISQLAPIVADSKCYEQVLEFSKIQTSDLAQSFYYSLLACLLLKDPQFADELVSNEFHHCWQALLNPDFSLNKTKSQMNNFICAVGIQKAAYREQAIEAYKQYKDVVKIDFGDTACKMTNVEKYITNAQKRNRLSVTRKSCRC